MNRRKESDWTRVLQERLRDAELPMESEDISAFSGVGGLVSRGQKKRPRSAAEMPPDRQPAARRMGWGLWAMAAVAAAAVAAVLLLRPVQRPVDAVPSREQDLLAETVIPDTIGNPDPSGDSPDARNIGSALSKDDNSRQRSLPDGADRNYFSDKFAEKPISAPPSAAGQENETSSQRSGKVPQGQPAAGQENKTSSNVAQNEEEIPDRVRDEDDGQARNEGPTQNEGQARTEPPQSLGELALADLPEEPDASGRAARRPRLTLHLLASSGGTSGSGGWGQKPMALAWSENRKEISYQPGHPIYSDALPQHSYGQGIPGINNSGNTGDVCLVEVFNSQTVYHTVSPAPAFPVSFGLSGELAFGRRWSLLSGLEYTQRAGYRMNGGIPQALTLNYLGVPLEARFHFLPEQRFRLYLGAGLKAEKCLWTKGGEPLKDPVLFSWNLQAGADFRLVPGVRLYLAPVVSQYLNRSAYANGWDEKPQFSLRAGLSFDL